jgi:hypothetical protein
MLDIGTPGRFRVGVDFSPGRVISSGPRCHTESEIEYGSAQTSTPIPRGGGAR